MGELLLPLRRVHSLTWDEVDSLFAGQDVRRQKDMVGFRRLSTQLYNLMPSEKTGPLTAEQFLPLPAVDGPKPKVAVVTRSQRMKDKYGDKLES